MRIYELDMTKSQLHIFLFITCTDMSVTKNQKINL